MKPLLLAFILLLLNTAIAVSQPLIRIIITASDAPDLAIRLERAGFDVLEGSVNRDSLELIATDSDLKYLGREGIDFQIIELSRPFKDIQADLEAHRIAPEDEFPNALAPTGYPNLAAIVAEMNLAAMNYPSICQVVDLTATYNLPTTYEGRHLYAVKISDNVAQDEDEPAFLLVGNHHSRELVTPVIALYALQQFTTGYGSDPAITSLVDGHEIWIAPVWNPDGYEYVFNVNNMWRKNKNVFEGGVGVDLNRNYPLGWESPCSGSTLPSSSVYKGPGSASEAETQTMIAWSNDRNFAKVVDYHSSGRQTLWSYRCLTHPFASFLQQEAIALSSASGYGTGNRPPSADGEHYQWQMGRSAHAFLVETHTQFQPSYASAQVEAATVFPGITYFLQRAIPLGGHVTDSRTGGPVAAHITYLGVSFLNGEKNASGGGFGRYHAFFPSGSYTVEFSATGYVSQFHDVTISAGQGIILEVVLVPVRSIPSISNWGMLFLAALLFLVSARSRFFKFLNHKGQKIYLTTEFKP